MINATIHRVVVPPATTAHVRPLPSWPAWSIAFLVTVMTVLPRGATYGMNALLLVLAAIAWAASRKRFDSNLLRAVAPFVWIIVIGLVSGFGADTYLYLKDAWYASAALVYIATGYVLYRCQPDVAAGLRAFVVAGTVVALYKLSVFVARPELLQLSAAALREKVGYGSPAPLMAIVILLAYFRRWPSLLRMPNWLAAACFFICALAVVGSFSRQGIVITGIGLVAAAGGFARREWLRFGLLVVVAAAGLMVLRASLDIDVSSVQSSLLGKIARAPEELLIRDYRDRLSIQANWRGYESAQALRTYASGSGFELAFGQGFGHSLDLGLFINLGGEIPGVRERINSAPILHNGYGFLLLKAGPLAVLLFVLAIAWFYRVGRRRASAKDAAESAPARTLQACAVIAAFVTWVSMGALTGGVYMLAAGYLLAALTHPDEAAHGGSSAPAGAATR